MKKSGGEEVELTEIVLFCRQKAKELRSTRMEDIPLNARMSHFAHIQDRSKETYVEVGIEALIRMQEWCFEHLKRRGWTHLISVKECADHIAEEIAFRFFKTPRPVTPSAISKMIRSLDDRIAKGVEPHRFLWPCHICYGDSPDEFSIGDVRFRPASRCESEISGAIDSSGGMLRESFCDRIRGYYRPFGWIADVTVETSDRAAAKRMSLLAVQISLTIIKLFLANGGAESRIRMSEQQNYLLERAELYFIGEKPHISWHQTGGQAPFAETWWDDLKDGDNGLRMRAAGNIARAAVRPAEQTFLKLKYISALRWFDDAANDTHAGARITKFVIVLEALTGCGERETLAENVAERVANFVAGWPEEGTPAEIHAKVKRIYAVRSELVHGERDPIGLELGRVAQEAAHLAHVTLVAFLDFLIFIGLDRNDYDNKRLLSDFAIIKGNVDGTHKKSVG